MKFNLRSLMKDKNVLRVVVFLSFMNLLGYIVMRDFDAVFFFILVGFITTYFSKNMIIVLLTAMLTANFFAMGRKLRKGVLEGMKNKKKTNNKSDTEMDIKSDDEEEDEDDKDNEIKDTGKLDHSATVDAAYEHLDNLLGSDTIDKMSDHTKKLADRQAKLGKQIEQLQPVISKSMQTLDKLGGVNGINKMVESLSNMVGKFPGQ